MGLASLREFRHRVKTDGIKVHGNQHAREGERLVCARDIVTQTGERIKGRVVTLLRIVVDSREGNGLGFSKRIIISGFDGETFNPKRFKKAN